MENDRDAASSLQFDTALPVQAADGNATPAGVTCASCARPVTDQYYEANGASLCEPCQRTVAGLTETPRGVGPFTRAALLGSVAAVLGAILYYAVMAITNLEVGLVAIAIGYMVGYGVRLGARGRGGRRFQILAVVLTYWAVGLAYTPFAFKAVSEQTAASASAGVPAPESAAPASASDAAPAPVEADAGGGLGLALLALVYITLALPVLSVIGSLPGGLLSAAIIAFGMHQAWRMTGTPRIAITGPYRIGAVGSFPAASGVDG
jgi:hypothetical protein